MMKKRIMLMLVALCMLLCVGCGADAEAESETVATVDNTESIFMAVVAADTTLPEMVTVNGLESDAALNFTALCDFEYDRVANYCYSYAKDGSAAEIAVICLKEKTDAAACMEALKDHIEARKGTFAEYAPKEVQLVDKAVVTFKDNYVLLAISEKNGMVQQAFKDFK